MKPGIETDHLFLRPLSTADAEALYRISNEPPVRRFLWDDEPVSETAILETVAESGRMFSTDGVGLFGVWPRGSGELAGFCGFCYAPGGSGEIELSYEISSRLWGRGLATEAARACLGYAFTQTNLEWVVAGADAPNAASLRVIEKLGMKPVDEVSPEQPGVPYFTISRDDLLATANSGAFG